MDESMFNSLIHQANVGTTYVPRIETHLNVLPVPSQNILQCDLSRVNIANHPHIPPTIPGIHKRKVKNENVSAEVITNEEYSESIRGSPAYFLGLLINDTVINWLIMEANTNGSNLRNFQPVTEDEMRCFIAILYLSGYVDVPRRRMLWERAPDAHCPLVSNAMQRDRFEGIFTALHMGDNSKDDVSRLARLTPFIIQLNERFIHHLPKDDQHSIAECSLPIGSRHNTQNIKSSNRCLRIWCGCIRSGYCVWLDPCPTDHTTHPRSVILTYAAELQRRAPGRYSLLFENKFGDLAMLCELQSMGIAGSGADREKSGCLLNPALGGVDKLECNVSLYRISIRGKKCYSALLTYVLDVSLHNAWQLYKISHTNDEKKQLDLLAFRRNVVIYYLQHYARPILGHRGGRPKARQARGKRACPSDARFDGIRHYVIPQEKQTRCAKCSAKTTTRCQKCDVGVHVKCFVEYHQRPKDISAET